MIDIGILRVLSVISMAATVGASATIVDEHSLVPISILIAAVTLALGVAWRVSAMLVNAKRDAQDMQKDIDAIKSKLTETNRKLDAMKAAK